MSNGNVFQSPVWRLVVLVGAGLAGMFGVGYQAPPSQEATVEAVRSSLLASQTREMVDGPDGKRRPMTEAELQAYGDATLALADGEVTLVGFRRDWLHEGLSSGPSRFLVDAQVVPAGGDTPEPRVYCLVVERQFGGTATASSPRGTGACGTFGW